MGLSVELAMSSFYIFSLLITSASMSAQTKVRVKKVSIKTGSETRAGTDAVATLRICDSLKNCCHTGDLDNPGNDRSKGQTDVYENSLLSGCRLDRLEPSTSWTVEVKLKKNGFEFNGWCFLIFSFLFLMAVFFSF